MLVVFGYLYFLVNGGFGSGFYCVVDMDKDGEWDKIEKFRVLVGGGEYGFYVLRLLFDGKSIYLIVGNHINLFGDLSANYLLLNWSEDLLLLR